MGNQGSGGYLPCLMCDADVPVSSSDVGQAVYCSYCQVSLKVHQKKKKKGDEEEDFYFEEDY